MSEAAVWDKLARWYDRAVRLFDRSYPAVRERLRRDREGRQRVLEIAAGTGQFTPDLAGICEQVVASDLAPAMVERLRQSLRERGVEGVDLAVMDATSIDAPDAAFDAVFCANALHVMKEPARALQEFGRVLQIRIHCHDHLTP